MRIVISMRWGRSEADYFREMGFELSRNLYLLFISRQYKGLEWEWDQNKQTKPDLPPKCPSGQVDILGWVRWPLFKLASKQFMFACNTDTDSTIAHFLFTCWRFPFQARNRGISNIFSTRLKELGTNAEYAGRSKSTYGITTWSISLNIMNAVFVVERTLERTTWTHT